MLYFLTNIKQEVNWRLRPERFFKHFMPNFIFDLRTDERRLFLTFDDGPNPNTTPLILECLERYNAKATFFLIGDNAKRYPYLVERICEQGQEIGYHTMHHELVLTLSLEKLKTDFVEFCEVVDHKPRLARPPFGFTNNNWLRFMKSHDLKTILTNAYPRDKTVEEADTLVRRLKLVTKPGGIILLHDGDKQDPKMRMNVLLRSLPQYLEKLSQENYALDKSLSIIGE